jgi:uncharacterized protein YndB with AHSA1/START domain
MSESDKEDFVVNRVVLIRARRATVFRYFTDTERFAAWWGPGSSIDPRPGGKVEIKYPGGATAGGAVVEIVNDQRIVFTYGYDDPSKPIPRGGSRVVVTLEDEPGNGGTLVRLVHHVDSAKTRDMHVPGWRFQLSTFANVVAKEVGDPAAIGALVDQFFAIWAETNAEARASSLGKIVTDAVTFHDAFACLTGRDDLGDHIAASQIHMPGVTLARDGDAVFCQGTALVDWIAKGPGGQPMGRGTNVFHLFIEDSGGARIAAVTGFWRK